MTLLDLLDELDRRQIRIDAVDGRLKTNAPAGAITDGLSAAIRQHKDLLVWTVVGRRTGHAWVACNQCGEVTLLDPQPRHTSKWVWPDCYMTPGCEGRHNQCRCTGCERNPGTLPPLNPDELF